MTKTDVPGEGESSELRFRAPFELKHPAGLGGEGMTWAHRVGRFPSGKGWVEHGEGSASILVAMGNPEVKVVLTPVTSIQGVDSLGQNR